MTGRARPNSPRHSMACLPPASCRTWPALRERFGPAAATPPAVSVVLPAIVTYDALLGAEPVGAAA